MGVPYLRKDGKEMGCLKHRQGASVKVGSGENRRVKKGKNGFAGFLYKWSGIGLIRTKEKRIRRAGNTQGGVRE